MKISTRLRYGTRAMLALAAHPRKPVPVRELARDQEVSVKYLEQIMGTLKAAGLITPIRGLYGGYRLARPPSKIRLIEVFRVLEGPLSLVDCVDEPQECNRVESCSTREIWRKMQEAMKKILEETTLQDVIEMKKGKTDLPTYNI